MSPWYEAYLAPPRLRHSEQSGRAFFGPFSGPRGCEVETGAPSVRRFYARVNQDLHAEGFGTRQEGRDLYREGEIRDAAGTVLARGRARFVIIDPERYNKKNRASAETDAEPAVETRARS